MDYKELYILNLSVRERLLRFLKTVPFEKLTAESNLGYSSARNMLAHIQETEDWWVKGVLKNEPYQDYNFSDFNSIEDFRKTWETLQKQTLDYVEANQNILKDRVTRNLKGKTYEFQIQKVLMHVLTHEFHHRGQICLLLRQPGFTPPDVDLI
ncbi:MAG: DinB family protein [candidate division Zixibacteria bacterium RBG-1]|nr:MAG: DinB family protein [candidate division Zixibacteria bacterium RBG-1]OGC85430.1 MAG: hypothetical protein A2V73_04950 [candidate division Zixibacteria bacterium RBG_19FT_COMBO_42_43]